MKKFLYILSFLVPLLAYSQAGADASQIAITLAETTAAKTGSFYENVTVSDATRVFYVAPTQQGNGSGDSEANAMTLMDAFDTQTAGDWFWCKAGDYGDIRNIDIRYGDDTGIASGLYDQRDLTNNNATAPTGGFIAFVGYVTTPGDITSSPYSGYDTDPDNNDLTIPVLPAGFMDGPTVINPFDSCQDHKSFDTADMPTISGDTSNAPDYLDGGSIFEVGGRNVGYIWKNWQFQHARAGFRVKDPWHWVWENCRFAYMGHFAEIEGQGGSNQELVGEGIAILKNFTGGGYNTIKNCFSYNISILPFTLGEANYNHIVDTEAFSDLNDGNPQDYYFHTSSGRFNRFERTRSARTVASRHSGHGVCFNYGSQHNYVTGAYVYGTAIHFDASAFNYADNCVIIKDDNLSSYTTNQPCGNNTLQYSGGGYVFMDDAHDNYVNGGLNSGGGFQDSQAHPLPDHASFDSAGNNNTFANSVVSDPADNAWAFGNWSGSQSAFNNLFIGNTVTAKAIVGVARPNSGNVWQNNQFINVTKVFDPDEAGDVLNSNSQFINNTWTNSANARAEAEANYIFSDEGTGQPPVITVDTSPVNLTEGDSYTLPTATASDAEDGDISGSIVIVNPVDENTAGTYTVTWNVSDSDGNAAEQKSKVYTVTATNPNPTPSGTYVGNNLMFTAPMIERIVTRYTSQTLPSSLTASNYPSGDFTRFDDEASAFDANNNVSQWDNWSQSNGVMPVSAMPMPLYGVYDQIHYAAIKSFIEYQSSGTEANAIALGNEVADRILAYAESNIQTTDLNADNTYTSPYMFVALRMTKFLQSWSLVEGYVTSIDSTERATIDNWFQDWAALFAGINDFSLDVTFGTDWRSENYQTTGYNFVLPQNSTRTNPINGFTTVFAQQTALNNVRSHIIGYVHTAGMYYNNASWKADSFEWYKMMLRFGHFSDGTTAEMVRSYAGNEQLGLVYMSVNFAGSVWMAISQKIAATNGVIPEADGDKYLSFVTSKGTSDYSSLNNWTGTNTSGGSKSILSVFKALLNYETQTGAQAGRTLNGVTIDGNGEGSWRTTAAWLSLAYPDDSYIQGAVEKDASQGFNYDGSNGNSGGYTNDDAVGVWSSGFALWLWADHPDAFSEVQSPTDSDGDGINDSVDNCPFVANTAQTDTDLDGIGDVCDDDDDNDGILDVNDNCPLTANADQTDTDGDGIGDACDSVTDTDSDGVPDTIDNCPSTSNADQADADGDGIGDVCDTDRDGDGVNNSSDNCPDNANVLQVDTDGDGVGDVCDNSNDILNAIILSTNTVSVTEGNSVSVSISRDPSNTAYTTGSLSVDNGNVLATLSGNFININGLFVGTSVVTYTSTDDPTKSASVTVTVNQDGSGTGNPGTGTGNPLTSKRRHKVILKLRKQN